MGRLNLSTIDHSVELGILARKGLAGGAPSVEKCFSTHMTEVGLDPHALMSSLSYLMQYGESDGIKLAAVKFATQLWMHPALTMRRDVESQTPIINFVVEGQNIQINNVLRPQAAR